MAVRVAVVHDYLTQRGGAERVVLAMMRAFPDARLITSVYNPDTTYPEFRDYRVETTWLNRVGPVVRDPRRGLPVLAPTFSSFPVDDVDVVLCSSSGWAHGVRTDAPKVVYCHNPARWLHQTADYLVGHGRRTRFLLGALRGPLTVWDRRAARSATAYLANSSVVRDRVHRTYGIQAQVLHPAVGIDPAGPQQPVPGIQPGFLLTVSRPRGYKHATEVAQAMARMPGERLVVVGGLPEASDAAQGRQGAASGSSRVTAVSDISDEQLRWLYANCSALLAVGHEDFGLTPIEANAFGKPVVCLRAGGYLDTVVPGETGVYVDRLEAEAVVRAVRQLRSRAWDPVVIKAHAARFSVASFGARLRELVHAVHASHASQGRRRPPPAPPRRPIELPAPVSVPLPSSVTVPAGPRIAAFAPPSLITGVPVA